MEDTEMISHVDHAYATHNSVGVEEDPLRLPDPEITVKTEIKTEPVEVKLEQPDGFSNPNDFEDPEHNIEIVNHTTFEIENVPGAMYTELQKKYEANVQNSAKSDLYIKSLLRQNQKLRNSVAKLKQEKVQCTSSIQNTSKKLYRDLRKVHEIQCNLQTELKVLKDENASYKTQLMCYDKMKKNHVDLETHILELRRQVNQFMKVEKLARENIKSVRAKLDMKMKEYTNTKHRLALSTKKLAYLKVQVSNLVKSHRMNAVKAKQVKETQENLRSVHQTYKAYNLQLKKCKMEYAQKIRELSEELKIAKAETAILQTSNKEKEATCKILKEKYKCLVGTQQQKTKENHELILAKNQLSKVRPLLSQKMAENSNLMKKMKKLNEELVELKEKTCEYCGL